MLVVQIFTYKEIVNVTDSSGCRTSTEDALPVTCKHACIPFCANWKRPIHLSDNGATRSASCYFFDFGVEIAQSTLAFFNESSADACRYARHTRGIFDPKWFPEVIKDFQY